MLFSSASRFKVGNFSLIVSFVFLSGCHPLGHQTVVGNLSISPAANGQLNLVDYETQKIVNLQSGSYSLEFPAINVSYPEPKILIYNSKNELALTLKIPANNIFEDGSFNISFRRSGVIVLGGIRETILTHENYFSPSESCLFYQQIRYKKECPKNIFGLTKSDLTCTDFKLVTKTGSKTVAYENRVSKTLYNLQFYSSDLKPIAEFSGETAPKITRLALFTSPCR